MNILLDTQAVVLWGLRDPSLPLLAQNAIADSANRVMLSAVSVWEMAIKRALGKLPLPAAALQMCGELVVQSGFSPLEITFEHVGAVEHLPPHHRDPFDRLLIAQATSDGLTIVSGDRWFDAYGIDRIWE